MCPPTGTALLRIIGCGADDVAWPELSRPPFSTAHGPSLPVLSPLPWWPSPPPSLGRDRTTGRCGRRAAAPGNQANPTQAWTASSNDATFPSVDAYPVFPMSSAAVGDVTGDGRPDVVMGGMDSRLRVYDASDRRDRGDGRARRADAGVAGARRPLRQRPTPGADRHGIDQPGSLVVGAGAVLHRHLGQLPVPPDVHASHEVAHLQPHAALLRHPHLRRHRRRRDARDRGGEPRPAPLRVAPRRLPGVRAEVPLRHAAVVAGRRRLERRRSGRDRLRRRLGALPALPDPPRACCGRSTATATRAPAIRSCCPTR